MAQARRLTRARLARWAVCEDTCDTAALVVSELVTNAIVHAAGERVVCELHDGDDLVRIAVRDEGCAPGEPHPSPQRPEEEHGRGLLLVAAMSRAWGAQDTGPGLLVWAELERSAGSERAAGPEHGAGFEHAAGSEHGAASGRTAHSEHSPQSEHAAGSGRSARSEHGTASERSAEYDRPAGGEHSAGIERTAAREHSGTARERVRVPSQLTAATPRPCTAGRPRVDTEVRSDLGWSAKKPPADGRGSGAEASWGTGTAWV
ncbi:ATP-binding protein [Streptomyces sp. Tue6028]|uniref:ATP-binding protein n=1 Tax=Streptomyces sp. Tue6028 TaxID=2036037 RepID=UPI00211BF47D|nr:ATP-binding protein [Streptomyces sp. Tue6028]